MKTLERKNKRVLIIHGWESNSREHWFLEEKSRLEKMGYQVTVPDMPNTFHPKQEEWVKVIEDFNPDKDSILIGHSLGGTTILRYLERTNKMVGQCFFIAAPIWNPGYQKVNNFFKSGFSWEKIKNSARKFVILSQTKDPWVDLKHGEDLSRNLGIKMILLEGSDHFDKIDFSLIENNLYNMKQVSLCLLTREKDGGKEILLAMKKRGFGVGWWNGTGGKFNPEKGDKNIIDTAIRETEEEVGVKIKDLEKFAILDFYFPYHQDWNQQVHVFLVKDWEGKPLESEEMLPRWFKINAIPFEKMWDDDQYWLPLVLEGKKFMANLVFKKGEKIAEKHFEFVENFE